MKYTANLDLLRAIAVLFVVFEHVLVTFKINTMGWISVYNFGKIGVFIFFVHTSLVLMYSLRRTDGENFMCLSFYVRRFFRIYPLAIVCVLIAITFHIPQNSWGAEYKWCGLPFLLANLLLVQNLFSPFRDSVIGPLWSLPIEVQMYLVLPLLYLFVTRINSILKFFCIYLFVLIAGIIQPIISCHLNFFSYAPCFMGGILAFQLTLRYKSIKFIKSSLWPLTILTLGMIFIILEGFLHSQIHRGWILCFLLGLLIPLFKEIENSSLKSISHYIAKYSFGIYLSHVPLLWISFKLLNHSNMMIQGIIFLFLVTTVPIILYYSVEKPLIQFGQQCVSAVKLRADKKIIKLEMANFYTKK